MERDFLGLNSKESLPVVKEICFTKTSGFQWHPVSEKASAAVPQLMSFDFGHGDKGKYDSMVSPGFMHIPTPDATQIQKSFIHNRQRVGNRFPLSASSSDAHHVHRPYDLRMFPVSNPSMRNPFSTTAQNLPMKPQLLGGIPVTTPHSLLLPWKSGRDSESPAQLTIFYAGAVNVYQDVTPEKAEAIMLLAGTGSHPKAQVQTVISKPVQFESIPANQVMNTPQSPLSVSSHNGVQSRSGSTSTDELMVRKTTPISTKVENMGPITATVPQARKASLNRFLEKRKGRVITAAPYEVNNKPLQCTAVE